MNIKTVYDYYKNNNPLRKIVETDTSVELYAPSNVSCIHKGLKQLLETGVINKELFMDAGCGDGRVIAVSAGVLEIPSIGIEYDKELVEKAQENMNKLGINALITQGNFTNNETYNKIGIEFKNIKTVFNYFSGTVFIARKITQESEKGTKFILYTTEAQEYPLEGLTYKQTINVNDKTFMHVYTKTL